MHRQGEGEDGGCLGLEQHIEIDKREGSRPSHSVRRNVLFNYRVADVPAYSAENGGMASLAERGC